MRLERENVTPKQQTMWLTAALLVPVIHCASRGSWLAVGAAGAMGLLINGLVPGYMEKPGKWMGGLQGIWNCVVIAQLLRWLEACWRSHTQPYGTALVLLALAAWLVLGGEARTAGVGCVLFYPVLLLLGAALLPAIPEIKADRLAPVWSLPEADLLTMLLIPLAGSRTGRGTAAKALTAGLAGGLMTAVITGGILSVRVAGNTPVPVYELSRSISFGGMDARLESITAVSMTLGLFVTVGYLLSSAVRGQGRRNVWAYTLLAGSIYVTGIWKDSGMIAIGSILVWVILPVLEALRKTVKKL